MNREELSRMVELLRDTAKLHQPIEEILTDVKAESFIFVMDSVLAELQKNESAEGEYIKKEDALKLQYRIDDSATLSTRDVVNVEDIEDLPTYSFPMYLPIHSHKREKRDAIPIKWLEEKLTNHPELSYATSDGIKEVLNLWDMRGKDNE